MFFFVFVLFDIGLVIIGHTGPIAFAVSGEAMFDDDRDIFINRAGVSLLFLDSQLRQQLENPVWLYL